ncbi:centromere protein C isoform X2 [Magnolia sinica]|uniref:centromere protein C isoform X2 n=1 Tax=Magnolia sinica TaxID=86752 RepID=UPI002659CEDD|nr:centromere protein C isoform X2 [Magnolia sinica]
MVVDEGDDLENDPFGRNFFPLLRTFAVEGLPLQTATDSDSIDTMLRSRDLKDPSMFLEQANAILSGSSELPKFEHPSQLPSEDENRSVAENGMENPQKRRPALGRRRAQFSFKLSQSEPVPLLDASLSIDHLQDPDEFFAAYERLENAEKELRKSRGETLVDPVQHPKDTKARRRRPGILGKTVNYKHLYPTLAGDDVLLSQEEMSNTKILSPSKTTLDVASSDSSQQNADVQPGESQEAEMANGEVLVVTGEKGSIVETENRVNILLDELLSTCRDLDGGETVSLLQERLHVKPVTLNKISLPDFESVKRNDIKASEEALSRPRKALSELQQGIRLIANEKTPSKNRRKAESFSCPQVSPTPPRSPFASMSMLKKRILQIDPPTDPFSMPLDADIPYTVHSFSVQGKDKQDISPTVGTGQLEKRGSCANDDPTLRNDGNSFSLDGKLQSQMAEESNAMGNDVNSGEIPTTDSAFPIDMPTDNHPSGFDDEIMPNGDDGSSQEKVKDMLPGVPVSEDLEIGLKDLTIGTDHCRGGQPEQSIATAGACFQMDGCSESPTNLPGQHNKDLQVPSQISPSKRKKKSSPQKQTKRARLCRQSLAGAGTKFEAGVRRSTRIRSRPLEHWRGERLLYGRIHDSLPTVIGVKYSSPGKVERESVLKVKSFVSEEYADLVELAALH